MLLAQPALEPEVIANQVAPNDAANTRPRFEHSGGEALSFAPKDPTTSIRRRGFGAAFLHVARDLPKTFGYLPGILALIGLWSLRSRPVTDADLLLQAFCLLLLAAIIFHAAREGYLAARHLLPIAMAATACLGAGAQAVADRFQRGRALHAPAVCSGMPWAFVLTLGLAMACVVYGVQPLHRSRQGHRAAADWLTLNADVGDRVVDTRGWTGLYSGLETIPYTESRRELPNPDLRYLVVEDLELTHDSRRSRTINSLLERAGTRVAAFPAHETAGHRPANVLIFRWNAAEY
jgi:hypothetical protein